LSRSAQLQDLSDLQFSLSPWLRIIAGLVIIAFGLQMIGLLKLKTLYKDTRFFSDKKPPRTPGISLLLGNRFRRWMDAVHRTNPRRYYWSRGNQRRLEEWTGPFLFLCGGTSAANFC